MLNPHVLRRFLASQTRSEKILKLGKVQLGRINPPCAYLTRVPVFFFSTNVFLHMGLEAIIFRSGFLLLNSEPIQPYLAGDTSGAHTI